MNRAAISASGSQKPTPRDTERVLRALLPRVGPENCIGAADLAVACGVSGRATRAVYVSSDGADYCLGQIEGRDGGVFLARTAEEAAPMTRRMRAKALSELARADARDAFWERLAMPVKQLGFSDLMQRSA